MLSKWEWTLNEFTEQEQQTKNVHVIWLYVYEVLDMEVKAQKWSVKGKRWEEGLWQGKKERCLRSDTVHHGGRQMETGSLR